MPRPRCERRFLAVLIRGVISDEEGVTLRIDLVSAVVRKRRSQQPPVLGHHFAVTVAKRLHEPGGALNVREQAVGTPKGCRTVLRGFSVEALPVGARMIRLGRGV